LREFGANSLYAFESAILKALAHSKKKQLYEIVGDHRKMPHPVGNVVGGGVHSSSISKRPNFQEFLVIPRSKKFSNDLKAMNYIYSNLKRQLKVKKVNDEGALLVSFDNEEALKAVAKESKKAEAKFGFKIGIGIDVAASTFFDEGKYNYNGSKVDSAEQYKIMRYLIDKYSLFYLEDPAEQHDFKGFAKLNKTKCLIVGDDLTATQYGRVVGAIRTKAINAMIIKPNQNGSLVELRNIFGLCRKHGIKTILSHRSGETMDDAIADYAVGFGADYIKCGVGTQWREVKLNRLKEIERNL